MLIVRPAFMLTMGRCQRDAHANERECARGNTNLLRHEPCVNDRGGLSGVFVPVKLRVPVTNTASCSVARGRACVAMLSSVLHMREQGMRVRDSSHEDDDCRNMTHSPLRKHSPTSSSTSCRGCRLITRLLRRSRTRSDAVEVRRSPSGAAQPACAARLQVERCRSWGGWHSTLRLPPTMLLSAKVHGLAF